MKNCPLVTKLMEEVRAKLDKENSSIADLARAIGKPDHYTLVHGWLQGYHQPGAEIALRLQAWAHDQLHRLRRSIKNSDQQSDGAAGQKQKPAVKKK